MSSHWIGEYLERLKTLARRAFRRGEERPLSLEEQALLNVKFFGYEMARRLAAELPSYENLPPLRIGLGCKPSTQEDMESIWCAYWARELGIGVAFHRKLWELCYVLQALWENDCVAPGKRGVVFGCGRESLPAYLASRHVHTLATDLPLAASAAKGWAKAGQHAGADDALFYPHLCTRHEYDNYVQRWSVDMNDIPQSIRSFDFCWSICALEHLGSIERGLAFVENAMDTLKPGGVAVHTTEFAFLNTKRTLDRGPTVLFLRRHFEELAERLVKIGHVVAPMDFDVGDRPMDKFIDVPPFPVGDRAFLFSRWIESYHLKVMCEGIPTTCYGMIIRKAEK